MSVCSGGFDGRVAIVMGLHDAGPHLADQLSSFLDQTWPYWDLYVGDDGGSGADLALLEQFRDSAGRRGQALWVTPGAKRGFVANYLTLLRNLPVDTDLVALSDQDDIWLPLKLERAIQALRGLDGPVLYCAARLIWDPIGDRRRASRPLRRAPSFRNALVENVACGNTIVMNRAALDLIRRSPPQADAVFFHDWWIYLLISGAGGQVIHDPDAQILYRQHPGAVLGAGETGRNWIRARTQVAAGTYRARMERNLAALDAARGMLTPEHQRLLDHVIAARRAPLPQRVWRIAGLGLYRQDRLSQLDFFMEPWSLHGSDAKSAGRARVLLIGGDGGYSGVPRYLVQMVRALRDQADVTVLSDVNEGGFDALRGSSARHLTVMGLKTAGSPLRALSAVWRLRAILRGGGFDLVWAHSRMGVLLLRLLMLGPTLRGGGPRLAITHHSLPFERGYPQPYASLLRIWEGLMIRWTAPHHIFFLTDAARQHFDAVMPQRALARHRLHVLTSCSDLGPLPSHVRGLGDPRILVMTGRDGYQKNLTAALRLFAHLPDSYRLVLCGAGTDHPAFRAGLALILDAGQQARVELRGPLSDVRPELARASGYLLTSRYEGLPLGALEAWEAGLPLVLSRIDGNAAILSHHPLALPLELSDMTDHASRYAQEVDALISRFLADRDQWQGCIRAAWAGHHDFEGWSGRLCRVVSMMLDSPMRAGPMREGRL